MSAETTITVRGEVVLPANAPTAPAADLLVQVEDVSRADAPSTVLGEQRQQGVPIEAGGVIPFEVEVPADDVDARRTYSIRAHVDVSSSGRVEPDDLISTQSYPVLTRGHGREATVAVKRI